MYVCVCGTQSEFKMLVVRNDIAKQAQFQLALDVCKQVIYCHFSGTQKSHNNANRLHTFLYAYI